MEKESHIWFCHLWGLINTRCLHQMTERQDPFLFTLELHVQGRESEAVSVPCPRLPGLPSGLASATRDPSPLPGHGGTGPASGGGFLRVNPALAMLFRRGLAGREAGGGQGRNVLKRIRQV